MNNTFSLSFSDDSFQLLHLTNENSENTLVSSNHYPYPQSISVDEVFNPDNLLSVIDALNSLKVKNNLEEVDLAISVPFNFAKIKKVAYPNKSDKKLKRTQIEWELESVISENIKEFKVSVLKENNNKEYSEALIVAIHKSLIKKLQFVAEESNTGISGIFLNCFSLENYLDQNTAFSPDQNYLFLKIGEKYIEQHFFLGKQYLNSYVDPLTEQNNRSREEIILELTSERYKQIANLAGQMENENIFNLIVYGNSVSNKAVETLKKGLSLSVEYAEISNYSDQDGYKYIEAWGSIL
jgi:Tfp pilus assembly PilM family ATPase